MISKVIVLIFLSGIDFSSAEEKSPYPDLSCHPGYDKREDYMGTSEASIIRFNSDCEAFSKDTEWVDWFTKCPKVCSLGYFGIFLLWNRELQSIEQIKSSLDDHIINNDAVTERIAKQIHSECAEKLQAVSDKDCQEWDGVISCMENAWSCKE